MLAAWLPLVWAGALLLVAASALERPIKRTLRTRWPGFDYDSQALMTWGIAGLGALTMLLFVLLALQRS